MRTQLTIEINHDESLNHEGLRELCFGIADTLQGEGTPVSDLSYKTEGKKRVNLNDEYDSN